MPAEVEYRPDGDYVVARILGAVHTESAVQMVSGILALVREHGCRRVLTDYQQAVLGETTTRMYEFVGRMDELGFPRDLKMAAVVTRDTEDHGFFETVARNQGWIYQLFDDEVAARAWLTED